MYLYSYNACTVIAVYTRAQCIRCIYRYSSIILRIINTTRRLIYDRTQTDCVHVALSHFLVYLVSLCTHNVLVLVCTQKFLCTYDLFRIYHQTTDDRRQNDLPTYLPRTTQDYFVHALSVYSYEHTSTSLVHA